jgi:hypothetical protein
VTGALEVVRGVQGTILLVAPDAVLRRVAGGRADAPVRRVTRVLGARNLAEALVLRSHGTRRWLLAASTVDAVHATSMVALALADPRRRRVALASALVASLMAGAGVLAAGASEAGR